MEATYTGSNVFTESNTESSHLTVDMVDVKTTEESLAANFESEQDILIDMIFIVVTVIPGGNLLVIGAVCVHPKLRSLANVFIVNLAVADLCVSAFLNSFIVAGILTHGNVFDTPWGCHVFASVCLISCTSSLWNVTAVSINRYISICHHMVYHTYFNKYSVPIMVNAVWIVGVLSDLPNFVGWNRHVYDDRFLHCDWDTSMNQLFKLYLFFMEFVVPFTILVFCYSRILLFFRTSKMALKKIGGVDHHNPIKTVDLRLLRSVAIVLGAFCFFWGPYTVFALLRLETALVAQLLHAWRHQRPHVLLHK